MCPFYTRCRPVASFLCPHCLYKRQIGIKGEAELFHLWDCNRGCSIVKSTSAETVSWRGWADGCDVLSTRSVCDTVPVNVCGPCPSSQPFSNRRLDSFVWSAPPERVQLISLQSRTGTDATQQDTTTGINHEATRLKLLVRRQKRRSEKRLWFGPFVVNTKFISTCFIRHKRINQSNSWQPYNLLN